MLTLFESRLAIAIKMLMKTRMFASADSATLCVLYSECFVARGRHYRAINYGNRFWQLHLVAKLVVKVDARKKQVLITRYNYYKLTNCG